MPDESKLLKIDLLGPPQVTFNGKPVTIKRKQTRAVLYFLACQKDPISRAQLIATFWPNLPEEQARKTLREILSALRAQFAGVDVIVTHYDQLSLNPDASLVDVRQFQVLVDEVQFNLYTIPSGKLPDSLYRKLREGVRLWRTSTFMDGFAQKTLVEFDAWITEIGSLLQYERQTLIERLTDHCISIGNLNEAIYWLWEALKTDPIKTDLHYLVLTCLRDSGKISEVIAYRQRLEQVYIYGYGLEVPQVLSDFINRVQESQKQFTEQTGSGEDDLQSSISPFVGRKEILHQLKTWSLRGGIAVIRGESGIGKSRVMQEFYNRTEFPFRALFCISHPMEQMLPFQPLVDGLRQVVKPEEWLALPAGQAQTLTWLFPELAALRSDLSPNSQMSITDAYPAIFDAVQSLFSILAQKTRLLVFLDNAQWADEASISLLSYIGSRGFFHNKGFLLIAYRLEDNNPPLDQFLTHLQIRPDFHLVLLDFLDDGEIAELTYTVLGKVPSQEFINKLRRDVGGNPYFLLQTLKLVMDYSLNIDSIAELQTFPIPREVRSVMQERMAAMDPNTQDVIQAAAVIGYSFTPELLEDLCQMQPDSLIQILETLTRLHLIYVSQGIRPNGGYAFSHVKMREAILAEISPARKRKLYRQVITAMEKHYGKPPSLAAVYAGYYASAGDYKAAFEFWLKAGLYNQRTGSKSEANQAFQKALNLAVENEGLFSDTQIHDLITTWADYAFDIGDLGTCDTLYQQCHELGEKRQSPFLTGTAYNGQTKLMVARNQINSAKKYLNLTKKYLDHCEGDLELISTYLRQGNLLQLTFDYTGAKTYYEKAAYYEASNDDEGVMDVRARAMALLSMLYYQSGFPSRADEIADLSIETSRFLKCKTASIQSRIAKSAALFYMANYREAIELSESALQDIHTIGLAHWSAIVHSVLSGSYLSLGLMDKAWYHTVKVEEINQELSYGFFSSMLHGLRGDIYRILNLWEKADEEYSGSIDSKTYRFTSLESLYKLGYVRSRKGDRQDGMHLIQEAYKKAKERDLGMVFVPAEAMLLIIQTVGDDRAELDKKLKNLVRDAKARGFGTLPLSVEYSRLLLGGDQFLQSQKASQLNALVKAAFSMSNTWLELSLHQQIMNTAEIPREVRQRSKTRVFSIVDTFCENAVQDPMHELVRNFVEDLEKNISALDL